MKWGNFTKRACEQRRWDIAESRFRSQVSAMPLGELWQTRDHISALIGQTQKRYVHVLDRLTLKLAIVNCAIKAAERVAIAKGEEA